MKSFMCSLTAGIAMLCAASLLTPADAAVALLVQQGVPTEKLIAFGDVTAAYANSTTSYTDVTASAITYTPSVNDCTTAGRVLNTGRTYPCLIKVEWSFDVTKSTATTGNCGVYVNGALVTASERYASSAAARAQIGGVLVVANTVVGAQTVKMQCVSADTNAFTVNNGHMVVTEIRPG